MTIRKKGDGRREFLKQVLVGAGAASLGAGGMATLSRLASGQSMPEAMAEDRFYVFAYFSGGWDVLLGLDPRDPSVFTPDTIGATRIQPGYELQAEADVAPIRLSEAMTLGPYVGELATITDVNNTPLWQRAAVIRGMSMDTLTHEVGRRRFLTGKPPSGLTARGSSGSSWLAAQFGGDRLIPNLSVRVESFNPDLPTDYSALRVSSADDLSALLRRANPVLDEDVDLEVDRFLDEEASCARSVSSPILRTADAARSRMRAVLDADVQALFNFRSNEPDIVALRERYGFTTGQLGGSGAQAALAAQALANGVARVVSIQATGGLDTHFDNWEDEQGPRQRDGFTAISRLAQHLSEQPYGESGESMLDRTTIVAFSEFMRTPLVNARGGRDHWLTNSCLVLGGNVDGGKVIGASSDSGMSPQPVDLATGEVSQEGEVIRPEHVLRSLLVDAGQTEDVADLRVPAIDALMRG
jgi:hypothetical protein